MQNNMVITAEVVFTGILFLEYVQLHILIPESLSTQRSLILFSTKTTRFHYQGLSNALWQ